MKQNITDPLNGLKGKKILLGITGGIAAYKCCYLIRELIRREAEVKVITTPSALKFVTPLTLAALSQNPVISDIFEGSGEGTWHIHLAEWADLYLIAPATLNTIAKIAHGFADNPVTTLALASRSPMVVCPAADEIMYDNPVARENVRKLQNNGINILDAESGFLASSLTGSGRLPELSKIIDFCETVLLGYRKDLSGKNILVTAGPTFEDIDPVRYIGNRSSGKMGYNLAKAAYLRGANVTLISGHTAQYLYPEIKREEIRSAREMHHQVMNHIGSNDILIMAAAVADYTPKNPAKNKIKKQKGDLTLELTQTTDILKAVDKKNRFVVGFALETEQEVANAEKKLHAKGLNMVVLNSAVKAGAGFEVDTNEVKILHADGTVQDFAQRSKFQMAHTILDAMKERYV